jgi:hypothetical protein
MLGLSRLPVLMLSAVQRLLGGLLTSTGLAEGHVTCDVSFFLLLLVSFRPM